MALPQSIGNRLSYEQGSSAFIQRVREFGGGWVGTSPEWLAALNSENEVGAYVIFGPNVEPKIWAKTSSNYDPRQAGEEYLQYIVLFSEPLDINGVFATVSYFSRDSASFRTNAVCSLLISMQVSVDSFSGVDGTWSDPVPAHGTPVVYSTASSGPAGWVTGKAISTEGVEVVSAASVYDLQVGGMGTASMHELWSEEDEEPSGVRPVGPYAGVRALRIVFQGVQADTRAILTGGFGLRLHLYGEVSDTRSGRKFLAIWDPRHDLRISPRHLEWGTVPVSTSGDNSFRIKNMSAEHTSYDVRVLAENPMWPESPFPAQQFVFSIDRKQWRNSVMISALSPGSVSPEIWIRRVSPANALSGPVPVRTYVGMWV